MKFSYTDSISDRQKGKEAKKEAETTMITKKIEGPSRLLPAIDKEASSSAGPE